MVARNMPGAEASIVAIAALGLGLATHPKTAGQQPRLVEMRMAAAIIGLEAGRAVIAVRTSKNGSAAKVRGQKARVGARAVLSSAANARAGPRDGQMASRATGAPRNLALSANGNPIRTLRSPNLPL